MASVVRHTDHISEPNLTNEGLLAAQHHQTSCGTCDDEKKHFPIRNDWDGTAAQSNNFYGQVEDTSGRQPNKLHVPHHDNHTMQRRAARHRKSMDSHWRRAPRQSYRSRWGAAGRNPFPMADVKCHRMIQTGIPMSGRGDLDGMIGFIYCAVGHCLCWAPKVQ